MHISLGVPALQSSALPTREFLKRWLLCPHRCARSANRGAMRITEISPRNCVTTCRAILATVVLLSAVFGRDFHLQLKTRTVYIVPMANSLDRHLASRLTSAGVLWVVLDPGHADAVLTDHVDEGFWLWSTALYGSAKATNVSLNDNHFKFEHPRVGENRGTIFLVDPRTGLVLWSIYEKTQTTSPNGLDQVAERVAKNLKKSLEIK